MSYKIFYRTIPTFVVALLLIALLSSCGTQTSAPAQVGQPPPSATFTPLAATYDNVRLRAEQAQRTADAIVATADALGNIVTRQAIEQRGTIAAIDAQVAANTQSALSLTQQVESFNAASTQQAVSMAATATAGALSLGAVQRVATQTEQAMAISDTVATQEVLRSVEMQAEAGRAVAAHKTEKGFSDFIIVMAGLFIIILVVAFLFAFDALHMFARGKVQNTILKERLQLVGGVPVQYNPYEDKFIPIIDGESAPALPTQVSDTERLRGTIKKTDSAYDQATQEMRKTDHDRRLRASWKQAGRLFLRWGVKSGSFGVRPIMTATGISDADWRTLTKWLEEMGFLAKRGKAKNAPWGLPTKGEGDSMTLAEVLGSSKWHTSFTYPDAPPPRIFAIPESAVPAIPHLPHTPHTENTPPTPTNGEQNTSSVTPRASKTWNMASDASSLQFYIDNPDAQVDDYEGGESTE